MFGQRVLFGARDVAVKGPKVTEEEVRRWERIVAKVAFVGILVVFVALAELAGVVQSGLCINEGVHRVVSNESGAGEIG